MPDVTTGLHVPEGKTMTLFRTATVCITLALGLSRILLASGERVWWIVPVGNVTGDGWKHYA